jgi:MarR family transcriptional regulator, transcriptional regulator for hemolysin
MAVTTKAARAEPSPVPRAAPAPPVESLCWLLSQASQALSDDLATALEAVGISQRAHCVLMTAMTGEFTQTELAQAVGLDKTTMVVTVDELELAGLAVRRPSPTDRRARVIDVTKAGERKVAQGKAVVERVQQEMLASLPASERKALLAGLERLARADANHL